MPKAKGKTKEETFSLYHLASGKPGIKVSVAQYLEIVSRDRVLKTHKVTYKLKDGYVYHGSSQEEIRVIKRLEKHDAFRKLRGQCLCIPYRFGGKNRRYYPDFVVLTKTGKVVIIEVKPIADMTTKQNLKKYKALAAISEYVSKIEITFQGTTEFKGKPIRLSFGGRTRNYTREVGDESWGNGVSQASPLVDARYRMDLSTADWYAYNDNCGTSEEKKFVKYFASIVEDLRKEYQQVFLIRNELEVAIYDFATGDKFEPDYVLFLSETLDVGALYTKYITSSN